MPKMLRKFVCVCFLYKPLIDQFPSIVSPRLIAMGYGTRATGGDEMRHSWMIDVLADLQAYAEKNNFPAIAASAGQTLAVARAEIAAAAPERGDPEPDMG